jgi:hypothetical protein
VGRHRQEEVQQDVESRSQPTQILPIVKQRRTTVSPLLLGAGGVAITLVLGVGGWALVGSRSEGNPLVFPWSADKPGDIDVSVSMVPTVEPSPSEVHTPSPSPLRTHTKKPQTALSVPAATSRSAASSPSRSPENLAVPLTATIADISSWYGNVLINVDVHNPGSAGRTWTVELWFDKDLHTNSPWNAAVQAVDARHLKFTAVRTLNAGETVRFGFIAGFDGRTRPHLVTCKIDGQAFPCSGI